MNKRVLMLGSTALLAVTLLGTGLANANGPTGKHGNAADAHGAGQCTTTTTTTTTGTATTATSTTTTSQTSTTTSTTTATTTSTTTTTSATTTSTTAQATTTAKVAAFGARVTPGHPCGWIIVHAKVLHPVRGTTFSASALAHFTSGDVLVNLRRAGKSFVAVGKIRVPADQVDDVKVDVTIVYGGVTEPVITRTATINAP